MNHDAKVNLTHTVKSANSGTPCADCLVRVTLDPAGNIHLTHATTDQLGHVTFHLRPGTYYLWRSKKDWIFDNPLSVRAG